MKAETLTPTGISKYKAKEKLYRVQDTKATSFFIAIMPIGKKTGKDLSKGTKTFQYRWRRTENVEGKNVNRCTDIPIGRWGEIKLEKARLLAIECHKLARNGANPVDALKQDVEDKEAITFEDFYNTWFFEKTGVESKTFGEVEYVKKDYPIRKEILTYDSAKTIHTTFRDYVLPIIGSIDISKLEPLQAKDVFLNIEKGRKIKLKDGTVKFLNLLSTRDKAKGWMNEIMNDAIALYPRDILFNPITGIKFKKKKITKNTSTVVEPKEIAKVFIQIAEFNKTTTHGQWQISLALDLLPLVGFRPSELCRLQWREIDFDEEMISLEGWEGDLRRTKMGTSHKIPMSRQTISILNKAKEKAISEGIKSKYVFPICNRKPDKDGYLHEHISLSGIQNRLKLYVKISAEIVTPHGFRAMLKTRLKEGISEDGSTDMESHTKYYSKELTEKALGHKDKVLEETYDRGEYRLILKKMYQDWADYLENLRNS